MRKLLCLVLTTLLMITLASAANLTVEIQDEDKNRLNSQLTLKQNGGTVADSSGFLDTPINDGENYTLIQQINSGPDVTIYNFSTTQDLDLKPTIYTDEYPKEEFLSNTDPLYFINQDFNFSKAQLTVSRSQPDSIAKCTSIESNDCSSWNVQNTSQYETSYSDSTFKYNITSFSGYTSGEKAPLPQIQNIQIYNVSGSQNPKTDGTLIDQGTNQTLQIDQKNPTIYRFNFTILNNGSKPWVLTSSDNLKHQELNQSWTINQTDQIFYKIGGTEYTGGTFTSGTVEWNTGNGGELAKNEKMTANYIVNVTQDTSNTFSQVLNASTTSNTAGTDKHKLRTLIYGIIDADIDTPQDNSVIQNNRLFTLNGTINCIDGDCGDITATPRQNTTTGQQSFTGAEFEISSQNNTCSNLLEGQSCLVEWNINATADPNTFHELDYLASSNYTEIKSKETQDHTVEIRDILIIGLDWNAIEFGVLDPGQKENPAQNNSGGYNISVESDSNTVDNLWLKASQLVSEQNNNYTIGPGNMTWSEQNDYSSSINLSTNYSLIDTDLSPGTTKNLHYWLNVPYGIISGDYTGTITFKANQTQ